MIEVKECDCCNSLFVYEAKGWETVVKWLKGHYPNRPIYLVKKDGSHKKV